MIETIKTVGAICASIAAIGGVFTGFWWVVRKIVRISDAVEQLKPNGGKSLSDKVNHISRTVDGLNTSVGSLGERVDALEFFDNEIMPVIQDFKNKKRGSK
jgi:outer membrane murein-binding lipoprotein Lpp